MPSADMANIPQAAEAAPHAPSGSQEVITDAPEPATGAETIAALEARIAELTARIAELEQEKADRAREDAITALAERYRLPAPVLRSLGDVPAAELEERARILNAAIQERDRPRNPLGRGGLDPNNANERNATWAGAFQQARENRSKGNGSATFTGNVR
ncbi:hypothetical protein [Streptomyces chattanoogensis]|uniref:hypothetical protein n=1 Tax=Streptomyces chattanoogensis TaxID=66876 RepID=UPI000AB91D0B|nr:hypothetical protein [Streptomyces chattanoogensis]